MKRNLVLFDGLKAVPIDPDADGYEWAWRVFSGPANTRAGDMDARAAYDNIGHIRRGLQLRANAVASCPRHYYKANGDEVSEADIPFLDGWQRTLKLIELSLSVWSSFYLWRVQVGKSLKGLRWMKSSTMVPKIDQAGMLTFERRISSGAKGPFTTDQVVYGWEADPFVEVGPGGSVLDTVLINAGVLGGINQHAKGFFERGAINPQLLQIEGVTAPDEVERFKVWWRQIVAGVRNAFASEVMRFKVNKVDLSAAAKDLGMPELGKVEKEDIATGLGIPYSLLFSDAANFATAQQDEQNFWNLTIKPELSFIQGELNDQVFKPLGMELYFAPEEMALFQEDEAKRATSLSSLVAAGMPLDIAMETLGYEPSPVDEARIRLGVLMRGGLSFEAARTVINMDEEIAANSQAQQTLELFRPVPASAPDLTKPPITSPPMPNIGTSEPSSVPVPQFSAPDTTQPAPAKAGVEDLAKWQRKALKRLAAHGRAECSFESDALPASLVGAIKGALSEAEDEASVRRVFAFPFSPAGRYLFAPEVTHDAA